MYCKAVLVRRDLDLETIGLQANFPETGSPIQLGTEGKWRDKSFVVVGRLAYRWDRGRWNEWHCRMTDGGSAWLSDAQLEYAMSEAVEPDASPPNVDGMRVGDRYMWFGREYEVATLTRASYLGTEGDLPFTSASREASMFVDLQSPDGAFATLDFSDTPPTLYVGEYCEFESLQFKNLREFEGWNARAVS